MGNRRLTINLFATVVSYSTTVLISFVLTPYLVETLGKEVYGFYPLANNFVNYISIVTVALNSMASRFITIEIVKDNKRKGNIYFSSVFFSNVILSIFIFIVSSIIVIFLDKILQIPLNLIISIKVLFSFVFLSMIINLVSNVFNVAVFIKNRIDIRSYIDMGQGLLRVVLYFLLFTFLKPSIVYVGIVSVILSFTYFISHYYAKKCLAPELRIKREYFDFNSVKEILSSGIWNSLSQLGGTLLSGTTILLANILLGARAAGEYSLVLTVPTFINGIISMLTSIFIPTITQEYANDNVNGLVSEVKKAQRIMGMITNIPIVVFIVVGKDFFSLWVPGESAEKLQVLSILTILHLIIVGVVWPVSNLNTVMNRVKTPAVFLIINGIVNVIITVILINYTPLGIYAVPLTMMLINLLWYGIFIPIYPCRELGIKRTTFLPAIIKTILGSCILYVISTKIASFFTINSWLTLMIVCIICGLIGIVINLLIIYNKKLLSFK